MDLPVLAISYEWNHRTCNLLYLASLTKGFRGPWTVQQGSALSSFLCWLWSIWLYGYTTICSSTHGLMGTWIVSIFWFFWTELLRTGMYMYLFGYQFSILFGIDRGRISRSYGNYITLERPTVFFFTLTEPLLFQYNIWEFLFPCILSDTCFFFFWFCFCLLKIIPILLGVKW